MKRIFRSGASQAALAALMVALFANCSKAQSLNAALESAIAPAALAQAPVAASDRATADAALPAPGDAALPEPAPLDLRAPALGPSSANNVAAGPLSAAPSAATNGSSPAGLLAEIESLKIRIDQLEKDQARVLADRSALQSQVDELNQKLSSIVREGNSGVSLNLLGKMQANSEFRDEVMRSVQGKIVVENLTGDVQSLVVNGRSMQVGPGSIYFWVPYGRVTARLNEGEAMTFGADSWHFVAAPEGSKERGDQVLTLRIDP